MGRKRKQNGDAHVALIGDNSNISANEKLMLGGYVRDVERIEAEIRELNEERSEVYKAAKEANFNVKALRHLIRLRRMDHDERQALEHAIDAYAHAMGDYATTPLGAAMAPQPNA